MLPHSFQVDVVSKRIRKAYAKKRLAPAGLFSYRLENVQLFADL
jgi:hypothetical protein